VVAPLIPAWGIRVALRGMLKTVTGRGLLFIRPAGCGRRI
jgi:hypothetical protein